MVYKVGSFVFEINNIDIPVPNNLEKFKIKEQNPKYYYQIQVVENIDIVDFSFQVQKENIKIVKKGDLEKRYLYLYNDNKPYAVYDELDKDYAHIKVDVKYIDFFSPEVDVMFISLLALERHMYKFNEFILHSSFVKIGNSAILFTAPSGVGKSTQADLWVKYRKARIINGDRSLVVKKGREYYAFGWPICGSSKICLNESYPIKSIILLSQGKNNKIIKPKKTECIKKILREITVNYHNEQFLDHALTLIEDIIKNVSIYHLQCDISEDAVECLENKLKEDGLWNEK